MYDVWFVSADRVAGICIRNDTHRPIVFNEEHDAWNFVEQVMTSSSHPLLMWVRKVENADH